MSPLMSQFLTSKLGRLTQSDIEQGFSRFMGRYAMGVRDDNGSDCWILSH